MRDSIGYWWCRLFHEGVINITRDTYECPTCLRLHSHNLNGLGECNNYASKKCQDSVDTPITQQ